MPNSISSAPSPGVTDFYADFRAYCLRCDTEEAYVEATARLRGDRANPASEPPKVDPTPSSRTDDPSGSQP